MRYSFVHVKNKEILDKVYRFRYRVMHEELGWIKSNRDTKEKDDYDEFCEQFAILNGNGEICCTMRLIHHSKIGYPTERFLHHNQSRYQFERDKLSELSRIFIDPKYRNMHETKIFISSIVKSLAYEQIKKHGIEYCYGMLEEKFLKLVNIFKIPYKPIGALEQDYDKFKYPSILNIKDLEKQNPQLTKHWEKYKKVSPLHLDTKLKAKDIIV